MQIPKSPTAGRAPIQRSGVRWLLLSLATAVLVACATGPVQQRTETAAQAHDNYNAVLWFQSAAEYHAAMLGIYADAGEALVQAMADPHFSAALEQPSPQPGLRPAVVVDVDETILDNSPYQARLLLDGGSFEETSWRAWCEERQAKAIPGALSFARHAAKHGVEIFYVSNRDVSLNQATIDNLAALGFPNADQRHVLLRDRAKGWGDKGPRRVEISKTHQILLLIGDNLGDFSDDYKGSPEQRLALVEKHRNWWGERWFLLPNPMYGSWEQSLLDYHYADDEASQRRRKRGGLRLSR